MTTAIETGTAKAAAKRIKSLRASSAKYGPCEACGEHVSEVHMLCLPNGRSAFGHRGCVEQGGEAVAS